MSQPRHGFRQFLGHPGVLRILFPSLIARLPSGMIALAVVLAVARSTHSYAYAGIVSGAYGAGSACAGPWRGRMVARRGARAVVTRAALLQGGLLIGLALACGGGAPPWLLVVIAALTGAAQPPLNPMMRTIWSLLLAGDPAARDAASSFESMAVDFVYVAGPLAVSAVLALTVPALVLGVAGVIRVAGSLGTVSAPMVHDLVPGRADARRGRHWLGPLRSGRVAALLAVSFCLFGSIVAIEVSVTAAVTRLGERDLAGVLIAALSVGGLAGGVLWGSRRPRGRVAAHAAILLLLLAGGWAALSIATSAWALGAIILAAGLALNPAITSGYDLLGQVTAADELTEAYGWFDALNAAGAATGAALAGWLAQHSRPGGFLLAAGLALAGAVCCAGLAVGRRPGRGRLGQAGGGSAAPSSG